MPDLNIPAELVNKVDNVYAYQKGDNIDMAQAMAIARGRFMAREAFATPAPTSFLEDDNNGPFVIFYLEIRARNMLVNRGTAEVTAMVDFEFTNTIPASFAQDIPQWLGRHDMQKAIDLDFSHGGCKHMSPW
ncbi:hypothetical protein F5Y16DRAFT_406798 [Xylariaceae sp. FL0255]|nr:hypothetical protein F5Y16DRAFT_406798 [Xylariaceae sp. FL0255]